MEEIFTSRKSSFQDLYEKYLKLSSKISLIRVGVFLTGMALAIYFVHLRDLISAFTILGSLFLAFGFIVNYHKKVKDKAAFNNSLTDINEDELKRINLQIDHFDDGLRHLEESHPYAYDLDIFGKYSLYQLINRAATPLGKARLASDLKNHLPAHEIPVRQDAIKELSKLIDWRQSFQANGSKAGKSDEATASQLSLWMQENVKFYQKKLWKPVIYMQWFMIAIVLGLIIVGKLEFYWIFLFNVVSALVLGPRLKYIEEFSRNLGKTSSLLNAYSGMLNNIEKHHFENTYLSSLQQKVLSETSVASRSINTLNRLIEFLDNRANLVYIILNSFFMLDIYLIYKAEEWKAKNGAHFDEWMNVIAEFESLASFSGFSYCHPEMSFPTISANSFFISTKNIAHPLIHKTKRVSNDFHLSGKGAIALITGSNMAGKSTFLRTMGINLVLAQSGAPVCASSFEFSPCDVFSSMRTKDNLEESVSTFYAELLRINQLIKKINVNRGIFYLLDEILKGTNSHDRQLGATALIKQLNRSNTFGLVSSHDIELAALSEEVENLQNLSFHSEIKENEILFDYKLHPGPCTHFNAVALMKKMGISIPNQ